MLILPYTALSRQACVRTSVLSADCNAAALATPCVPVDACSAVFKVSCCTGSDTDKMGHMRVCKLLRECTFPAAFQGAPLVAQYSSVGYLTKPWLAEFGSSFSAGCDSSGASDRLLLYSSDTAARAVSCEDLSRNAVA